MLPAVIVYHRISQQHHLYHFIINHLTIQAVMFLIEAQVMVQVTIFIIIFILFWYYLNITATLIHYLLH